jgi:hypothetical protein
VLTVHADAHRTAVAVDGDRIVAVGTTAEVTAGYPGARVRQWPGTLTAGRTHTCPLPTAPSPRERVHALLRDGVTAVTGEQPDPQIRAALARAGLDRDAPAALSPGGRADFAVFDEGDCLVTVLAGRLVHRRS